MWIFISVLSFTCTFKPICLTCLFVSISIYYLFINLFVSLSIYLFIVIVVSHKYIYIHTCCIFKCIFIFAVNLHLYSYLC